LQAKILRFIIKNAILRKYFAFSFFMLEKPTFLGELSQNMQYVIGVSFFALLKFKYLIVNFAYLF